jgi:hypothetical protein
MAMVGCFSSRQTSSTSSCSSQRRRRRDFLIRFLLLLAVLALISQGPSLVLRERQQEEGVPQAVNITAAAAGDVDHAIVDDTLNRLQDHDTTTPFTSSSSPHHDFLLNVPFYVYDNDLLWINKTSFGGIDNDNNNSNNKEELQEWLETKGAYKHSDDYWFAQAALHQHPQRTWNPDEAKLFVVPLLLNTFMARLQLYKTSSTPFCITTSNAVGSSVLCEKRRILRHMNQVLQESTWFQRHDGRDHVVVASHYQADYFMLSQFMPQVLKCNLMTFEGSRQLQQENHRIVLPSMYVGRACPLQSNKTDDVVMVGSLTGPSLIHFKRRREMCQWLLSSRQQEHHAGTNATLSSSTSTTRQPIRMSTCGEGPQCPALAQARFGLHVRGDTFGANRLLDTLLSGSVPIFTWSQQYDILPDWIDWKRLSSFADISSGNATSFVSAIQTILADDEAYQEKQELVLRNRDLFDWKTPVPFDVYMYILSTRLWPDDPDIGGRPPNPNVTRRYTALILPKTTSTTTNTSTSMNGV